MLFTLLAGKALYRSYIDSNCNGQSFEFKCAANRAFKPLAKKLVPTLSLRRKKPLTRLIIPLILD